MGRSSAEERLALNQDGVGSNPSAPTKLTYLDPDPELDAECDTCGAYCPCCGCWCDVTTGATQLTNARHLRGLPSE
jgi:hypothetical protein